MITIEEVRQYLSWIANSVDSIEHPGQFTWKKIAELAISQHAEIERLKTILREAEHLASAEKGNLCARIIHMKDEIERLRAALQESADCLWNNSLNTAARKAEQVLKSGETK